MALKQSKLFFLWAIFALFAIVIGLYPTVYLLTSDTTFGLLSSKTPELLQNVVWHTFFYTHIIFGGLALLTGFSQFSTKLRRKRVAVHRNLGKAYCIAVALSGTAGFYIAFFATGGLISGLGFGTLAVLWLGTTLMAYKTVREKLFIKHEMWMIRSYALCFGAVTLRLWLPLFTGVFKMDFIPAYLIIAWLAWVPNLLVAEIIIKKKLQKVPA